jgi:predicted DNA-binding protein
VPNLSIYLDMEKFEQLLRISKKRGVTPAKLARELVEKGLEDIEKSGEER